MTDDYTKKLKKLVGTMHNKLLAAGPYLRKKVQKTKKGLKKLKRGYITNQLRLSQIRLDELG